MDRKACRKHIDVILEWVDKPNVAVACKFNGGVVPANHQWTRVTGDDVEFNSTYMYALIDDFYEERKAWAEGKDIYASTNEGNWVKINSTTYQYPFTIYKWKSFRLEQEWYDNIPKGGVLCWVSDESINVYGRKMAKRVYTYKPHYQKKFETEANCKQYKHAVPVTKEEILNVD